MTNLKNEWISFFYKHKKQIEFLAFNLLRDKNCPLTVDDFIPEAMDEIKKQLESQKDVNTTYILKACEFRFRNIIRKFTSKKHNVLNNAYFYDQDELFDIPYIDNSTNMNFINEINKILKLSNKEKNVLEEFIINGENAKYMSTKYHISPYYLKVISNQVLIKIMNII